MEPDLGMDPPVRGWARVCFFLWTPGTRGEPMFTDGCFFSFSIPRMVGRCEEWLISGVTDTRGWTELYSGKRVMVRAGGSASRIIGDRSPTDPGGGRWVLGGHQSAWQQPVRWVLGGHQSAWQQPVRCGHGSHCTPNVQEFPA